MFRASVRRGAVCLALAGLALVSVHVTRLAIRSGEPHLDFSRRIRTASPSVPQPEGKGRQFRFAVATMVSAEATFSTYRHFVRRICRDIGHREAFVVRPSYADVRSALEQAQVDAAFVCTGTYIHSLSGKRVKLLVQPEFEEPLQYRCLILVPAQSGLRTLDDLRGRVMAFTDPESHTGCLVPSAVLARGGHRAKSFFRKVVFTGSHDRSILAVALPVVDAAAVDSLIWVSKLREDPSLADRVRVIWQSEPFGPPPIVVPVGLDRGLQDALREALLALDEDDEGREILSALGIKRFVLPKPESYGTALDLYRQLQRQGAISWP